MLDVQTFREQGYLVLRDAVPAKVTAPFIGVLERRVDQVARQRYAAGLVDDLHADLPFERRLAALYAGQELVMREWNSALFCPEFRDLVCSPAIVEPLVALLGPEVTYQGNAHLRPYLSRHLDRLPWHQDAGFYGPGIEHMLWRIVQVWLPFVDVDIDTGCLALVPGSHHFGLIDVAGWEHEPETVYRLTARRVRHEEVRLVPLRRGDLLVFTNLLAHTGTENRSGTVRWSVDMRFEAAMGPDLTDEERLGYAVTRRRMASRQAVPLRVAGASGPQTWEEWQERRSQG